ncbi:MAG: hypothetical protein A2293_08880 [Elusimicrobia bacterium RIFOXYB2_FULL_49_7]|nr:MAG: hypothetical protein A2293_08880 [Elusimicrobia bacterium RIFOXYB2_FULL_49_7]
MNLIARKKRFVPVILFSLLSGIALFLSCGNPTKPEESDNAFQQLTLTVRDTLLDTVEAGGKVYFNKKAFFIRIQESESWDPVRGEPIFYTLYKVNPKNGQNTFVRRFFGGGNGFSEGDTIFYRDAKGLVDTLVYDASMEDVIVISVEDKAVFQFGVAVLSGVRNNGRHLFSGGSENKIIRNGRLLLGGVQRSFVLNRGDLTTVDSRVTIRALFDTTRTGRLFLYRYSTLDKSVDSRLLFSMDSLIKRASVQDTQYVRINSNLFFRIRDSGMVDPMGLLQGQYGGMDTIPLNSLSSYFDLVRYGGEPGWVYVEKRIVLPRGFGHKWVFLKDASSALLMYDNIDIEPFRGSISLDLQAGAVLFGNVPGKVCLVGDEIPFVFDKLGDTTYTDKISIWIATRNLFEQFMGQDGSLSGTAIEAANNSVGFSVSWPDAIIETPPVDFSLPQNGTLFGRLKPDYEDHYRISPLRHLYNKDNAGVGEEYNDVLIKRPENSEQLGQMVLRGSILGYAERNLNKFAKQDSVINVVGSTLGKIPFTGWFEYVPLATISGDSTYSPNALFDYFHLPSNNALIPNSDSNRIGNKYYSIFSAFCFSPERFFLEHSYRAPFLWDSLFGGLKLYRNPLRSIPIHINKYLNSGKEFIIIAVARGKYFDEPRVFLSKYGSSYTYVWDKSPPHFSWAPESDPTKAVYAPLYYVNALNPKEQRITDLSKILTPYIFNVSLSPEDPSAYLACSVRDMGFGRIASVRLCFNYSSDFLGMDPITGRRRYSKETIVVSELSQKQLRAQQYSLVTQAGAIKGGGFALRETVFSGIDARFWQKGLWDMWIETSDDLGNSGVASIMTENQSYNTATGMVMVRQVEIK